MNIDDGFSYLAFTIIFTFLIFIGISGADVISLKVVGTETIDNCKIDGVVLNVSCTKNVTCSWLKITGDYKCKDLQNFPDEEYKCINPTLRNGYLYCDINDIELKGGKN